MGMPFMEISSVNNPGLTEDIIRFLNHCYKYLQCFEFYSDSNLASAEYGFVLPEWQPAII